MTICPVLTSMSARPLGPLGGNIEAPWTWVLCPSRCESHPMAGARASLLARGFRLRLPALCPGGSPCLHSAPSVLQLHGIHWYTQTSSRMSRCGGPRGHALLWTLGRWAGEASSVHGALFLQCWPKASVQQRAAVPAWVPWRLTLRNTVTVSYLEAIPGSTVEVVERWGGRKESQ